MDSASSSAAREDGKRRGATWQYGALAAAAIVVMLLLLGRLDVCPYQSLCGPLLDDDVAQGRLDTALPPPRGASVIEQSFVPRRNGLTHVNLLLARYGEAQPGESSTFTLELWDGATRVAGQTVATATLAHNQPFSLDFPPQPNSAGRRYVLRLSGSEANPISVWGYSLDVYGGGEPSAAGPAPPPAANSPSRAVKPWPQP